MEEIELENIKLVVNGKEERIDKWLSMQSIGLSRTKISKLLEEEKIKVNGETIKPSYVVNVNDEINIELEEKKELSLEAENIPIDVIYEDEYILVVNKPKGLVVHPGNGNPNGTLVNALLGMKSELSTGSASFRPGIVHRIDKDTSRIINNSKK